VTLNGTFHCLIAIFGWALFTYWWNRVFPQIHSGDGGIALVFIGGTVSIMVITTHLRVANLPRHVATLGVSPARCPADERSLLMLQGASAFPVRLPGEEAFVRFDLTAILVALILFVVLVILSLFFAAVYRRAQRSNRYKQLDEQRDLISNQIKKYLDSGKTFERIAEFASTPNSMRWQASEESLLTLLDSGQHENEIGRLFVELGYVAYYEKKLLSKNTITKASAIDKLGKMRCERSTDKLVKLLKDENPEIAGVAVRSISKIGSPAGLRSILDELPNLLSKSLVSRKTIETSLVNFGSVSIPALVEYAEKNDDPMSKSLILEILFALNAVEAAPLALANFRHDDPEVRAKALKLIGIAGSGLPDPEKARITALLLDPVWFVRLQAAKALGSLRYVNSADRLGEALLDRDWQVRNAAATALTRFGPRSIDIFLRTLQRDDRYAKESICEEIEKTNYIDVLIENLSSNGTDVFDKSKRILEVMMSLNYWTPVVEYVRTGTNDRIKRELELLLTAEPVR
jgi:HEAT repeat protein